MRTFIYTAVCVSLYAYTCINPVTAQEASSRIFYEELEEHHQQCITMYKLQSYDLALDHGLSAISMSKEADFPSKDIVESFEYCGIIFRDHKKDAKEAINYLNKALLIYQMENNYPASTRILSDLALCYEAQGNYQVGLDYRMRSFKLANEHAIENETIKKNYQAIISNYEMLGNVSESSKYQKLYKQYLKAKDR